MCAAMTVIESTKLPDVFERMGRAFGEAVEQARHQPIGPHGKHLVNLI